MAERVLELDNVRAGYGETVVLEDIRLVLGASETVSIIGRNGVGKTTLLATIMGHTTLAQRPDFIARKGYLGSCDLSARHGGLGYVPQEREIFPSLTLRENLEVAARPGRWTMETVFELFPRLAERARKPRQSVVGRRAADACDRSRADRQSERAADGRAFGGPGAGDRRGTGARGEAPRPDQRTGDHIGRAELTSCARYCAARHGDGSRADRL